MLTGPGRPYFLVVALVFMIGVALFGVVSWRAGVLPRGALVLYVTGLCTAALRTSVPEWAYLGGLVAGSAGVLWLSVTLLRDATRPALVTA